MKPNPGARPTRHYTVVTSHRPGQLSSWTAICGYKSPVENEFAKTGKVTCTACLEMATTYLTHKEGDDDVKNNTLVIYCNCVTRLGRSLCDSQRFGSDRDAIHRRGTWVHCPDPLYCLCDARSPV